mmetsp:Transcript_6042/g.20689  ORF Transcript_6042/g.20689 Transcript_6042/m.20689 type:complete len:131 (-) Transcript_6042:460-852(-)
MWPPHNIEINLRRRGDAGDLLPAQNIAVALDCISHDNTRLMNSPAVDQYGLSANPRTDLRPAMREAPHGWLERRIVLPDDYFAHRAVGRWVFVCEYDRGGKVRAAIRNVRIVSRGGEDAHIVLAHTAWIT